MPSIYHTYKDIHTHFHLHPHTIQFRYTDYKLLQQALQNLGYRLLPIALPQSKKYDLQIELLKHLLRYTLVDLMKL